MTASNSSCPAVSHTMNVILWAQLHIPHVYRIHSHMVMTQSHLYMTLSHLLSYTTHSLTECTTLRAATHTTYVHDSFTCVNDSVTFAHVHGSTTLPLPRRVPHHESNTLRAAAQITNVHGSFIYVHDSITFAYVHNSFTLVLSHIYSVGFDCPHVTTCQSPYLLRPRDHLTLSATHRTTLHHTATHCNTL